MPVGLNAVDPDPLRRAAVQARTPRELRKVEPTKLDFSPRRAACALNTEKRYPTTCSRRNAYVCFRLRSAWSAATVASRSRPGSAPRCADGTALRARRGRRGRSAISQTRMVSHLGSSFRSSSSLTVREDGREQESTGEAESERSQKGDQSLSDFRDILLSFLVPRFLAPRILSFSLARMPGATQHVIPRREHCDKSSFTISSPSSPMLLGSVKPGSLCERLMLQLENFMRMISRGSSPARTIASQSSQC